MHINLFFCENASTGMDGKLNVQGIYYELYSKGFPARQDRIILAGAIEWDYDKEGQIPFKIDIVDPEEQSIFTINAHSDVEARSKSQPAAISHLIFPLENLIFTRAGQYRSYLTIENEKISGPSLYVLYSDSGM